MDHKTFMKVATAVFGIVAIFHAWRLVAGWPVTIGGYNVPLWWSIAGAIIAAFLSWNGYKHLR